MDPQPTHLNSSLHRGLLGAGYSSQEAARLEESKNSSSNSVVESSSEHSGMEEGKAKVKYSFGGDGVLGAGVGTVGYGGQHFEHLILRNVLPHSTPDSADNIEINTTGGIPFDNEYFRGKVIFKLKPPCLDDMNEPYRAHFGALNRKFELQVQGRFKQAPTGSLWLGAEIGHCDSRKGEDRMRIGFVKKTLCRLILNTMNLMRGNTVHYSFGDDGQLPHIVMPLHTSADSYVETDSSERPPAMGVKMFEEDEKAFRARRKSKARSKKYELGKIYSFTLHNGNLDLYSWKAAGIPGASAMDLVSFWGDMPLRICAYETDGAFSAKHTKAKKKYLYCFELKNLTVKSKSSKDSKK